MVFALTLGACSENENELPDITTPKGERMTFTVSLPGADTRLSHEEDGNNVKVGWTENDALMLFDKNGNAAGIKYDIVKTSISNDHKTADFTGDAIVEDNYYVFGPAQNDYIPADDLDFSFSFLGQVQNENDNLNHLAAFNLISAEIANGNMDNLSFSHQVSIFQFKLTGLPAGTYNEFTIKSSVSDGIIYLIQPVLNAVDYVQEFPVELTNTTLSDSEDLTIWMMMPTLPTHPVFKAGTLTLEVADSDGATYSNVAAINLAADQIYNAGTRYSMTAAMKRDLSMRFTVAPTGDQTDFTFPFAAATNGYTLTVDWGDGSERTTIPNGTGTDSGLLTHPYTAGKSYQITLTTDAPATGEQMPRWSFGGKASASMLVSMDSPMLNMNATNFTSCFSGCTSLATIPEGLFANNKKVTSFNACFQDCTKAVLNSDIFCNETTQKTTHFVDMTTAVDFTNCFNNVGSDPSANSGSTAPALWEYTYGAGVTSTSCFTGCTNVTNYDDIQAATGWY